MSDDKSKPSRDDLHLSLCRLLSAEYPITPLSTDAERRLVCPVCSFDYVHFELPYVVDHDNHSDQLIIIPMWSECGSEFEIRFRFHEGQTETFVSLLKSCNSNAKSYVYFIEAIGLNRIKIGVSDNPKKRLKQLATSSPVPLLLKGITSGGHGAEKYLHRRFEHLRLNKEWFHASNELIDYIHTYVEDMESFID
jgi:hypothetical protein